MIYKSSVAAVTVLLNFSKVFDSMSHNLLLRKLRDLFGLSSVACTLIGSFLDSRSQRVRLNEDYSESVVLTSAHREVCYFLCEEPQCSFLRGWLRMLMRTWQKRLFLVRRRLF
jgi:hypothetical protein